MVFIECFVRGYYNEEKQKRNLNDKSSNINNLTSESVKNGLLNVESKSYSYDVFGNRTAMTVSDYDENGSLAESLTTNYTYDLNNRLTTETTGDSNTRYVSLFQTLCKVPSCTK